MPTDPITIPGLGTFDANSGLIPIESTSDGRFHCDCDGVRSITTTGDRKVEFVAFTSHTLAHVKSALGCPAYYPVPETVLKKPVKAVLMDLDGTSVRSEEFWIWIIERSTASVLGNPDFRLSDEDLPYVSGHSVSEHLQYCLDKYAPGASIEKAREFYFEHTRREMREILEGRGRPNAFTPTPGLKDFLLDLKRRDIRIGLVTSGLHEKAWPEILSAFRTLEMGDPAEFYDAAITAGFPLGQGAPGTLGELSPKPHPWLYAETATVGLGIPVADRHHVIGIEDSAAGVLSLRLAGFTTIGLAGGNIEESGARCLCHHFCETLAEIGNLLV